MANGPEIFYSIYLDRKGNIVEVRDARNEVRQKKTTEDSGPVRVGGKAPSGKLIKAVSHIELVTVENDGDHDDPCWVRDRQGNWRCVCSPDLC